MLSKNEFFDSVKRNIINFLPDEVRDGVEIDETTIVKMNDQKLHGLIIKEKDADAAPNFYLDDMFERYSQGEDMGSLMAELSENYVISRDMPRPMDIDFSWDNVKDSLTLRLLETKRNREFLSTMPHVNVGNGLAMTVDVNMGEEKGKALGRQETLKEVINNLRAYGNTDEKIADMLKLSFSQVQQIPRT